MSPHRIAAIARRIAQQFRHDRRSLALLLVAPIVIVSLLAWILRGQQAGSVRLAVVDPTTGGRFAAALVASAPRTGIEEVVPVATRDEAVTRLRDGTADIALLVPAGLGSGAAAGTVPAFTVVTPGVNPGKDGGAAASVQKALLTALSTALPGGIGIPSIVHETVYGSPDADTLDTFAPVFVGFFAYFFVFILTGVSFLRERLGGTLERLLATPVTRGEIVTGYSAGFGFFATIQVVVLLAYVFMKIDIPAIGPLPSFAVGLGVPTAGSPILGFVVALLLALGAVTLGIFLSTFARTELQVLQFIPLVIVPQGLLGGILWPVDQLPALLQPLARVMPVTYAIEGLREVMIKGADLGSRTLQVDLLVLAGIAAVLVGLAGRTIRREVV